MTKKTTKKKAPVNTGGQKKLKPLTVEKPIASPPEMLRAIADTLMKNLAATPMNVWDTPIMSALNSAYTLGARNIGALPGDAAEEGEDRTLTKGNGDGQLEETAHDIMMAIGRAMAGAGIKPQDLQIRCDSFITKDKQQYFGLTMTIPATLARSFK